MNNNLFKAVLAMDSYNRGYEVATDLNTYDKKGKLVFTPNKIGNAEIFEDSRVCT